MFDQAYVHTARKHAGDVEREIGYLSQLQAMKGAFYNVYHLADANLMHFLPGLNAAERRQAIAETFYQQRMTVHDYTCHGLVETTRVKDLAGVFDEPCAPRIYCLYHVGSYRHVFHFLARENVDCMLFIAEKTLAILGPSIRDGANKDWPGKLEMINAEAGNSLLRGARALKRGQSVAIYIDGNAGTGTNWENDKLQPVDFFGQTLLARTGIGYLSHLSGVPVVPVTCMRDEESLSMTFHSPIAPGGSGRDDYVRDTTRQLYKLLEREIAATPGQWEGWLYVHKYLKKRETMGARTSEAKPLPDADIALEANLGEFAVMSIGDKPVLLDKRRHSFSLVDEHSAEVFRTVAAAPQAIGEAMHKAGIRRLIELGALVPAAS